MVARLLLQAAPGHMPQSMLLLAIAAELGAAGFVFYDGLMSIISSLL